MYEKGHIRSLWCLGKNVYFPIDVFTNHVILLLCLVSRSRKMLPPLARGMDKKIEPLFTLLATCVHIPCAYCSNLILSSHVVVPC